MKDGKYVGEDEYKPIELCANCLKEFEEFFPQAFALRYDKDSLPRDDEAMTEMARVTPHVSITYTEPEIFHP
jgi:hypothetical protein